MMESRRVIINAIASVVQIIVISVVLFILYRFLLNTIGVEQLGIWSLVLATTSVSQIANLGLTGSVVKFVARYVARGEDANVSGVIQTAALSVATFVGSALLIGYPVVKWLLGLVIENEFLPLALSVLPYAFWALWIMVITSIFQAGLDGFQRIDIRSILLIGGSIFHLLLCFILAPEYGLIGVAYARIIQNIAILFCSWFFLVRQVTLLPVFPYKWDRGLFKEIIRYAINFQVISLATMLYDPITKALLSKFGGLSMLGYYEMASKMIRQARAVIVSANQVLVPTIADLKENAPEKIRLVYETSYQLLFYLAVPLYSAIIVCIPIISELWIGHYEKIFVLFSILLTICWFLNTLSAPAYFANLGIGDLHWNVVAHIVIALLNGSLGFLLGVFFNGIGVVVAWLFSMALGSSLIYISYNVKNKVPLVELIPRASRLIVLACLTGILSTVIIHQALSHAFSPIALFSISFSSFLIIVFIPFWLHPMRKRFAGWVFNALLKKEGNG